MTLSIVNGLGRNRTVKFGGATAASKRDSSAAQADSFAGANEKKMRRPAPVGMTGFARGRDWKGLNDGIAWLRDLFAGGDSLGFSAWLVSGLACWCKIFATIFCVEGVGGLYGFGISRCFVDFACGHAFACRIDFGS